MAIKFSQEQVIDRIKFENPWWETNSIDEYYGRMKEREYFKLFYPLLVEKEVKRAVVLMGPRRVGKTVILYHSIGQLLREGIPSTNICYFSIETPLYNGISLEELLNLFLKANSKKHNENLYIFFDEIQYLKDWEIHLKSLVDSYHHIKFVVSGSAAAALKLKSQESGAGRFTEFILPPLTFHEFLYLSNRQNIIHEEKVGEHVRNEWEYSTNNINKLNELFIEYINYGGYPELSLSEAIKSDPGRYIRNDIIDKVLMRDLPSLYGISDIQELNSLFTYIAYNSGNEMSLDGISQNSGVAKNTIRKYITYLEAAFLIKVVHRVDQSGKKFKRANFFKIYLTNPSIRAALFSPISGEDEFIGNMVETAIYSQWQHSLHSNLYYARWPKGEIDIVSINNKGDLNWCIEIKWSNRYVDNPKELKNLIDFSSKHNISRALVTTVDILKNIELDTLTLEFEPASLYCFKVGRNLIRYRNN